MSDRLTEKIDEKYCYKNIAFIHTQMLNKLGQLEDIEQELGIDLITLFKALKNGVWTKYKTRCDGEQVIYLGMIPVRYYPTISLRIREFAFECDKQYWKLKDYGKTWALTKEELL